MDLMKNNPEEALKYAIPLDNDNTSRGGDIGEMGWGRRWGNFSLFGNSGIGSGSGGGSLDVGDHFQQLERQYYDTARQLIGEKKYKKAAFIYMKLLRNYHLAASTMEQGKHYEEAATIYLKYNNNKEKAAESGVYVYRLEGKTFDGKGFSSKGNVTLIR